jgi:DNA-directed RNA polymerase II subunit RPB9
VCSSDCADPANDASSNLLFPREDKAENKLLFACRTCSFAEEAPSSCVMRHDIASTVGDTAGVTAEVGQDPTVGLSRSFSRASLDTWEETGPFICTMCGQEIVCEDCGKESAPGYALETMDEPGSSAGDSKQFSKA